MTKRIYIRGSNYGGEMTIGTITGEFVEYWQNRDEHELIEHLQALEEGENAADEEGFDPDSPDILDDMDEYYNWYEIDDIHHQTQSSGLELMAFEMDEDGGIDWDKRTDFDPYQLYSRECYTCEDYPDDHPDDDPVPVLIFYSSEKGDFGGWLIELEDDEEFDPAQVAVASVETDHGEMIERLWYKKEEYEQDYDFVDSRGKGYYAAVAWFNRRWEDPHLNEETDKETWDEVWEYYEDHVNDSKEETVDN